MQDSGCLLSNTGRFVDQLGGRTESKYSELSIIRERPLSGKKKLATHPGLRSNSLFYPNHLVINVFYIFKSYIHCTAESVINCQCSIFFRLDAV